MFFSVDKTDSGYLNKLHANYEKAPSNLSGTKKSLSDLFNKGLSPFSLWPA